MTAFFDHLGGQGDIGRNDKIAGIKPLDDLIVRDIETGSDLQEVNINVTVEYAWNDWRQASFAKPVRSAARNKISLITAGQASASTHIFISYHFF